MVIIFLFILGILNIIGIGVLIIVYLYGYLSNRHIHTKTQTGKIAIIVPCKGLLPNLKNNLTAICQQSYPNFEVIFILDSKNDPAYDLIYTLTQQIPHARLVYAKKITTASGKISALLAGISHSNDPLTYVFADADIHPQHTWLETLVAYLPEENIGATTGFRWYFPTSLKTSLIATWNMATISSLYLTISNYTWGGSTAISRKLFEKLNIAHHWQTGFSDDLILTQIVKKNGYNIKFVPQSIVESPEETTITTFLKWGTQQFTWMRWYYPFTYYLTFIGFIVMEINIAIGFFALIYSYTIPGILLILTLVMQMLYGVTGIITLQKLSSYPKKKFGRTGLYPLLMPLVFLLFTYNYLVSSVKREIIWTGTHYRKKDS
jgi:cellulose synthase/poly-beta-1,6-N-acetylglucosamine synthase-like glycosyltransferase